MTRSKLIALALSICSVCTQLNAQNGNTSANWRSGGTCYEVFVRSFYDSDGDGTGDFRGLTQKLDYINDGNPQTRNDLGANCIWLMPIAESPSYHGYDVTNYYQVNRDYGTNEDFKQFIAEAHRRGIRVLFDLVLNHTSSEHPFFRSAIVNPQSAYRDWYLWSPTQIKLSTWNSDVWHRAGSRNEYYFGLFWAGMPDLNLANPQVQSEIERVSRFWLQEMNVDGFRLDAVQHFFESGDNVRHVPPIHSWLRDFTNTLNRIKPDVYTVGEVWDSTGAIVPYYPDQLTSYFIFEVADALVDAVNSGNGTRLVNAVNRAQRDLPPLRWSPFLRNHDQTRTMTDLNGDVARAKLAATLLLTLPGFPFVYYGEEIGMTGNKRDGDPRLRTPMQWDMTKAAGFTNGVPWEPLQPDSFTANVEAQRGDRASLLNLYRTLIHLRAQNSAIGTGDFTPLNAPAGAVAYMRRDGDKAVAVVANLTTQPLANIRLSLPTGSLAAGRYNARELNGNADGARLNVGRNGQISAWVPVTTLGPLEARIYELVR